MNGPTRATWRSVLPCLLLLAGSNSLARAQDAHYWSDQWGTRANLLGGVVIGSPGDLSSTYYNPGFLGLVLDTSYFLATKVYELSNFRGLGISEGQLDLSSTRLSAAPDLIAGEFTFGWLGGARMAYSLLTRYSTNFEIKGRVADQASDGTGPSSTLSSGEILFRQNVGEYWAGISYARPIGGGLGLGATLYGCYRNQRQRNVFTGAVSDSTLQTESFSGISDENYWNGRFLMKFGLAWRRDKLTLGLNYTSPSLSVLGQGSYFEQLATAGVNGFDSPLDDSFHSAVYEDGLSASYKTSWAAGLGSSYRFGQVRVHISVEYFDELAPHLVMQTSPWYPQTGGETVQRGVYQALESVFNFGIGVEVPLSDSWRGYGSVIADHSGALPRGEDQDRLSIATWDIYQLSAGAEIKFSRGDATVGLSYAFANDTVPLDSIVTEGGNPILGDDVQVRYRRLKLLLGFSIAF